MWIGNARRDGDQLVIAIRSVSAEHCSSWSWNCLFLHKRIARLLQHCEPQFALLKGRAVNWIDVVDIVQSSAQSFTDVGFFTPSLLSPDRNLEIHSGPVEGPARTENRCREGAECRKTGTTVLDQSG